MPPIDYSRFDNIVDSDDEEEATAPPIHAQFPPIHVGDVPELGMQGLTITPEVIDLSEDQLRHFFGPPKHEYRGSVIKANAEVYKCMGTPLRSLNLTELGQLWNDVFSRLQSHPFPRLSLSELQECKTKYEAFMTVVGAFTSTAEGDQACFATAIETAVYLRRSLTIWREDFPFLFDPELLNHEVVSRASDRTMLSIVTMVEDPVKVFDCQTYWSLKLPFPPVPAPNSAEEWHRLRERVCKAKEALYILVINIEDPVAQEMKRAKAQRVRLVHSVALTICKKGTSILQSFAYEFNGEVASYGLQDWIKAGHARLRTDEEMTNWFRAFKIVETKSPTFNSDINGAWQHCFDVDWIKVVSTKGKGASWLDGSYEPWVRCVNVELMSVKHLVKFDWKMDEFLDKKLQARLELTKAKNVFAKPDDVIPGFPTYD